MYNESEALTVYQHLLDQTPTGPRIIEMGADKTCKCYVLPRSSIADMVKEYRELRQHCIYILLGKDAEGRPMAYIGESKDFSDREKDHEIKKKFWDKAMVFVSRADNIYQSEIDYLEHLAQKTASEAGSYILDNSRIEQEPGIQPTKKQEMTRFFKDIVFLTRIYGCTLFDPSEAPIPPKEESKPAEVSKPNVWIIPSKKKKFDLEGCFAAFGEVYWTMTNNYKQMKKGDRGYIYSAEPDKAILYSIEVLDSHLPYSPMMDKDNQFSKVPIDIKKRVKTEFAHIKLINKLEKDPLKLKCLEENSLNGAPQSAMIISQEKYQKIFDYIESHAKPYVEDKVNLIPCRLKRNSDANGLFNPDTNELTILKGSKINPGELPNLKDAARMKRNKLMEEYAKCINGEMILQQDVSFDSPSGAAKFCIGGAADGWESWLDNAGKPIKVYRK